MRGPAPGGAVFFLLGLAVVLTLASAGLLPASDTVTTTGNDGADPAGAARESQEAGPAEGTGDSPEIDPEGTSSPGAVETHGDEDAALTAALEAARALLDEDQFEEALAGASALVEAHPEHADSFALLGDALYRRGDFEESEAAYRKAIALDEASDRGQFGMGRIMRTLGRYGEAAGFFHKAATLDPENAEYLRVLSNHLARREDALAMMEQYLEMTLDDAEASERIRKNVSAWVELLKFLGDEPMREIVESEPTALPMNVLRGQAYFKAAVNRKKGQRFAFDTGATGMTISPRLARSAKVKIIKPFDIVGMGGKGTVSGDLVLVRKLTVGGIVMKNVTATVAEPKGPEEGLMGPPLFSAFRILIDLDHGTLTLVPRESGDAGGAPAATGAPLKFRNVGGQMMVKATLNGTELNAMVDTGASSSLSSFSAVPRVPGLEVLSAAMSRGRTFGLGGQMARKTIKEATLGFAGKEFPANGLPSVDLSNFSRALESEVYLVIGFPELEKFLLEIDYRTNTLWVSPR